MASRSDSGNETRGSSESDNSPTPTKELHGNNRYTPPVKPGTRSQIPTPILIPVRPQVNTRTTPVSRTTPLLRNAQSTQPTHITPKTTPIPHRFTPTTQSAIRHAVRPLQRRAPSSGMGSAASVHTTGPLGSLGSLASSRGRQRNSVAIVDSREHIYEELDILRGPPKLAPVSGVLGQGKVVIRPIAFKPIAAVHSSQTDAKELYPGHVSGTVYPSIPARPDPRYTSTPTLSRGPVQHYGSMGDLKTLNQLNSSGYCMERRNAASTLNRKYKDAYADTPNNINNKINNNRNLHNNNNHMNGLHSSQPSGVPFCPKGSPHSTGHSPPYPQPPPRPPSHHSSCSTTGDNQSPQQRFPYDNNLSATFDPMPTYDPQSPPGYPPARASSGYDSAPYNYQPELPRFESMRNLSTDPPTGPPPAPTMRMGGSVSNLARLTHHSSVQALDRSLSVTGSNLGLDRSGSTVGGLTRGPMASVSASLNELRLVNHLDTPSPSDSGVAELEAMLKEKHTEINTLRETMEQNEHVIFKVYEQKEKDWERELKKIRDLYDARLKAAQQKALKAEHTLSTSTYQLQQDKRKLTAELEESGRANEIGSKQLHQLKTEIASLRSQLEETEWGICQKSGEISLLKTQLKDSQGDQTTRGHELLHLRAQVRQYQQEVERRRSESSQLHDVTAQLRRECADWRAQVDRSQHNRTQDAHDRQQQQQSRIENDSHRREIEMRKSQFEDERKQWTEEKERVLRYQKQLHHNYVSVVNTNRSLEKELSRLTGVPCPNNTIVVPPLLDNLINSSSHC